ncbi:MAG: hypothetical protein ACLP1D_14560 [Xanthobacteraceae bacterium]
MALPFELSLSCIHQNNMALSPWRDIGEALLPWRDLSSCRHPRWDARGGVLSQNKPARRNIVAS